MKYDKEKNFIECPVEGCEKHFWRHAMKGHIRAKARSEVYDFYKGKIDTFPHEDYIQEHTVEVDGEELLID